VHSKVKSSFKSSEPKYLKVKSEMHGSMLNESSKETKKLNKVAENAVHLALRENEKIANELVKKSLFG
jgi:hypothetical protein